MPTVQQLVRRRRQRRVYKKKNRALEGRPQARAVVESITVDKPKKPNSSNKKVATVIIQRTGAHKRVYIPGEGHNLQQHSIVLIRGGFVRDLPGVRYKVIRNARGTDLQPPNCVNQESGAKRQQARSKYGQKKADAKEVAAKKK
jgi:small subunit ribosomal protein S12